METRKTTRVFEIGSLPIIINDVIRFVYELKNNVNLTNCRELKFDNLDKIMEILREIIDNDSFYLITRNRISEIMWRFNKNYLIDNRFENENIKQILDYSVYNSELIQNLNDFFPNMSSNYLFFSLHSRYPRERFDYWLGGGIIGNLEISFIEMLQLIKNELIFKEKFQGNKSIHTYDVKRAVISFLIKNNIHVYQTVDDFIKEQTIMFIIEIKKQLKLRPGEKLHIRNNLNMLIRMNYRSIYSNDCDKFINLECYAERKRFIDNLFKQSLNKCQFNSNKNINEEQQKSSEIGVRDDTSAGGYASRSASDKDNHFFEKFVENQRRTLGLPKSNANVRQ